MDHHDFGSNCQRDAIQIELKAKCPFQQSASPTYWCRVHAGVQSQSHWSCWQRTFRLSGHVRPTTARRFVTWIQTSVACNRRQDSMPMLIVLLYCKCIIFLCGFNSCCTLWSGKIYAVLFVVERRNVYIMCLREVETYGWQALSKVHIVQWESSNLSVPYAKSLTHIWNDLQTVCLALSFSWMCRWHCRRFLRLWTYLAQALPSTNPCIRWEKLFRS